MASKVATIRELLAVMTEEELLDKLVDRVSGNDLQEILQEAKADKERAAYSLNDEERECPQCHEVKKVGSGFGTVVSRGKLRAQSWCIACRTKKAASAQPSRRTKPG